MSVDSPSPNRGSQIPGFELIKSLGCGTFGEVWLGRHESGFYRAVKIVRRKSDGQAREVEKELSGLQHYLDEIPVGEPRQLSILPIGEVEGGREFYSPLVGGDGFCYLMELADDLERGEANVPGFQPDSYRPKTLKAVLDEARSRDRVPLAPREVVRLGIQLVEAVAGLHSRGLIHRDIKPGNVIYVRGWPKLADIGLVTANRREVSFAGTPGYFPPDAPGTRSADLYAIGKVLFELGTGLQCDEVGRERPDADRFSEAPLLRELQGAVIARACHRHPPERYSDAEAMLQDLRVLESGASVVALRARERRLRMARRIGVALAAALVAISTLSLALFGVARRERQLRADRERALYAAEMSLGLRAWEAGELGQARHHLRQAREVADSKNRPDFEWRAMAAGIAGDISLAEFTVPRGVRSLAVGERAWEVLSLVPGVGLEHCRFEDWQTPWPNETWPAPGVCGLASVQGGFWLLSAPDRLEFLSRGVLRRQSFPWSGQAINLWAGKDPAQGVWLQFEGAHLIWLRPPAMEPQERFFSASDSLTNVSLIELSGNGRYFALSRCEGASQSRRDTVEVWEAQTGRRVWLGQNFRDDSANAMPYALALDPQGQRLALALQGTSEIQVWELDSGRRTAAWQAHRGQVVSLEFAPGGEWLASAGGDHQVRAWDLNGRLVAQYRGHRNGVGPLCWSPDGDQIVSIGREGDGRIWPFPPRVRREMLSDLYREPGGGFCLSPEGRWLAVTKERRRVQIYDLEGSGAPRELAPCYWPVLFENERVLAVSPDRRLQWWEADDSQRSAVEPLLSGDEEVYSLALEPVHQRLLVGGSRGSLAVWDIGRLTRLRQWVGHDEAVLTVAPGPEGKSFFSGDQLGRMTEWSEVEEGHFVKQEAQGRFHPPDSWIARASPLTALAVNSVWLVAANNSAQMMVFSRSGRSEPVLLEVPGEAAQSLAFSPDGRRLAVGTTSGIVQFFDTATWRPVATFSLAQADQVGGELSIFSLQFNPAGDRLVAFTGNGLIRVWRAPH